MDEEKEKMKTGKKLVIALIMILLILTAGAMDMVYTILQIIFCRDLR